MTPKILIPTVRGNKKKKNGAVYQTHETSTGVWGPGFSLQESFPHLQGRKRKSHPNGTHQKTLEKDTAPILA